MALELLLITKHFYFFLPPAHELCVLREHLPIYRTCVVIKAEISFMACDMGRKERYQRQSSSRDLWMRCCAPAGKSGLWSSRLVLGSVWGPTHKDRQGNVWAHDVLTLVLTACWVSVCQGRTKRSQWQFLPTWSLHLEPLCEVCVGGASPTAGPCTAGSGSARHLGTSAV